MSKGDGDGVVIRPGLPWLPATGEPRRPLKEPINLDTHETEKDRINKARQEAERRRRRKKSGKKRK